MGMYSCNVDVCKDLRTLGAGAVAVHHGVVNSILYALRRKAVMRAKGRECGLAQASKPTPVLSC